jgi:uncharacterized membrane protein
MKLSIVKLQLTVLLLTIFTTLTAVTQLYTWVNLKFFNIHNAIIEPPLKFVDGTDSNGLKPFQRYMKSETLALGFHVFPTFIWNATVLIQFSPFIRRKYLALHRLSGYVMAATSILMSIGILGMARRDDILFIPPSKTPIPVLHILISWFMYTLVRGILAAKNKNIIKHQQWMSRHAASGLFVGLQRIFLIIIGLLIKFASPILNEILGRHWFLVEDDLTLKYKRIGFSFCTVTSAILCIVGMEYQIAGPLPPSRIDEKMSKND